MQQKYELVQYLGRGTFGEVYVVSADSGDTLTNYALKVVDLRTSQQDSRTQAVKEADILRSLNHPNVLTYFASFEYRGAFCLVTEYCVNGDLLTLLNNRKRSLTDRQSRIPEAIIIQWFGQVASALQYIHGESILHRDIKTQNIFLSDNFEAKLGDFGLAKVLESPDFLTTSLCGTPYYMSPEMLLNKPYGEKSDIWAFGVVMYEITYLRLPFEALMIHQFYPKIKNDTPLMPTGYSPEFSSLLSSMLNKDPGSRPSANEILSHDLFKVKLQITLLEKQYLLKHTKMPQSSIFQGYSGPFHMQKILEKLGLRLCNPYELAVHDKLVVCDGCSLRVPSSHTVLTKTGRLCIGCHKDENSVKQTNVTKLTDFFKQEYTDNEVDASEFSTVFKHQAATNLENLKPITQIQNQTKIVREFECMVLTQVRKVRDARNTKITPTTDKLYGEKLSKDSKDNEQDPSLHSKEMSADTKERLQFVYETIENQLDNHDVSQPVLNTRSAPSVRTPFKIKQKVVDIKAQTELSRQNTLAFLDKMRQMRK